MPGEDAAPPEGERKDVRGSGVQSGPAGWRVQARRSSGSRRVRARLKAGAGRRPPRRRETRVRPGRQREGSGGGGAAGAHPGTRSTLLGTSTMQSSSGRGSCRVRRADRTLAFCSSVSGWLTSRTWTIRS